MDCAYRLLELKREDIINTIVSLPIGHPMVGSLTQDFETVSQQILNYNHNKPMNKELTIAEQLMENHNSGLFTVVQDEDDEYKVFSTLNDDGNLRDSGWYPTEQLALEHIGEDEGYGNDLDECATDCEWKIIRTINPSDYMKECGKKNTKEIKDAIETLKKAGMLVDGKILSQ